MASSKKNTGMGTDAFFSAPTTQQPPVKLANQSAQATTQVVKEETPALVSDNSDDKAQRRSFNLSTSVLRLLEEIQIKTIRDGNKQTLSAIVERGIRLAADEMGVSE